MQEALLPWYSIEQYFVLLLRLHVGLSDFLGNGMACGEIIAALCRRRRCRRCRRRCCCCDSFVLPQPEPSSAKWDCPAGGVEFRSDFLETDVFFQSCEF